MRMSHSKYCPILMSARQVLSTFENRALIHTALRTAMALQLVSMDAIITVLIAYFCNASVVMSDHP